MSAKGLVSDELWALIEPLLPPRPPGPKLGRPRVSDRSAFASIVYDLRSGIPWRMLPDEFGCSGVTCWRRLRDWGRCVLGRWESAYSISGASDGGISMSSAARSWGLENMGQ
jgi:transposase